MTLQMPIKTPTGVEVLGPVRSEWQEILSLPALELVADLARRFEPERQRLLQRRTLVQGQLDSGRLPDFLTETAGVREGDWRVAEAPEDLRDRRVEITGPVDRKMVINALNSGANVFMADFEDSNAPTWTNVVEGQVNLRDAVRRTITFDSPDGAKHYELADETATLVVRPRGWHLPEAHVTVDGEPVSAALFDFALFFFHNAAELIRRGTGPYFYLPKLESHLEARLWNDVFVHAQSELGIPRGTIRATVLIETLPGGVRDGRDPVRAARALQLGSQLRPLGLHLQRSSRSSPARRRRSCCPTAGAGRHGPSTSCAATASW